VSLFYHLRSFFHVTLRRAIGVKMSQDIYSDLLSATPCSQPLQWPDGGAWYMYQWSSRLSVSLVHPSQGVEAFGNISSPPCALAILWPCKILQRSSRGNPSAGGVKRKTFARIRLQQVTLVEIVDLRALFLLSIDIHYKTDASAFYAVF